MVFLFSESTDLKAKDGYSNADGRVLPRMHKALDVVPFMRTKMGCGWHMPVILGSEKWRGLSEVQGHPQLQREF